MDDKTLVKTMANTFTCTLAPKVISLAKRRGLNLTKQSSSLLEEMEEAISNDTAKKSGMVHVIKWQLLCLTASACLSHIPVPNYGFYLSLYHRYPRYCCSIVTAINNG